MLESQHYKEAVMNNTNNGREHCHPPGRNLFINFSVIHRFAKMHVKSEMKKMGIENCFPPYLIIIFHEPGISQEKLSEITHIDKGFVAKSVRYLAGHELLVKKPDPYDKRCCNLFLTEKGKALIPRLMDMEKSFEKKVTSGMTADEIACLRELTDKAAANFISAKGCSCCACGNNGKSKAGNSSPEV